MSTIIKKTPLYDCHVAHKAKLVDFSGWKMPISYGKVVDEHNAVRSGCGLFDVSHMGEIFVAGSDAATFLQSVTTNDLNKIKPGQGQYTLMCNEEGGVVDDLICYKLNEEHFLLCVNASNSDADFAWLSKHQQEFAVTIKNASDLWSQIAIQGPSSQDVLAKALTSSDRELLETLDYMSLTSLSNSSLLARTGYTGEHGYELYLPNDCAAELWQKLVSAGGTPAGLGARDTLRLEACYLLYGNDMDETVTPLEAGVAWAVKVDKGPFIGKSALVQQKEVGLKRRLRAFLLEEPGIARSEMTVFSDNQLVGQVTSGSVLPTIKQSGGLCLIDAKVQLGDTIQVDVRGKRKKGRIVKKPIYQAKTK